MPKKLIVPLTKSPHRKGRYGQRENQDWYRGIVLAKKILNNDPNSSKILVISNFFCCGESEVENYMEVLVKIGVSEEKIEIIRDGYETVGQLEIAQRKAKEEHSELFVITSFLHSLRVRWICRHSDIKIKHIIVFGIPRPMDILSDVIILFLYPIIEICGLKKWFLDMLLRRRNDGIL